MPEHIAMIKKYENEDKKVKKPVLDEYELEEINDLLVQSILDRQPIQIKLWLDGIIENIGPLVVTKIDPYTRKLYVMYKDSPLSFSFDSLIGANRV